MVNSPLFWSLAMYHANWARWICIYHTCCKNKGDPLPEGFRLPLLGCMFPIWPNSYHSLWPVWMTCLLFLYFSPHVIYLHIYTPSSPFSLSTDNSYIVHACMYGRSSLFSLSIYSDSTYVYIWSMLCSIHLCMFKVFLLYICWSPSYTQENGSFVPGRQYRSCFSPVLKLSRRHFSTGSKFKIPHNHFSTGPSHQPVLNVAF